MHKIFIRHRSKHHSSYSGYAKLLEYVDAEIIDGHQTKLPFKLAKWFSDQIPTTSGNYDSQSAKKEVELFNTLKANSNKKSIVHYLNGERDVRYNLRFKKKFSNTKFVATFHKPPNVLKDKITNLKYLKKLDAAVCVGANQVDFIKNWLKLDNVEYIPHGVDINYFKPDANLEKEHCILFVGQHLRDFETLNWVIPKFLKYDKNLKVKVVGTTFALKKVNTAENVVKLSDVDDSQLRHLYQSSKLLFLPLKGGTACNSILEAMACGLPIVTNKIGGNEAYLQETNSCFENNPETLLSETINLIEDEAKQNANSLLLRKRALEYDWTIIADKINKFHVKLSEK